MYHAMAGSVTALIHVCVPHTCVGCVYGDAVACFVDRRLPISWCHFWLLSRLHVQKHYKGMVESMRPSIIHALQQLLQEILQL